MGDKYLYTINYPEQEKTLCNLEVSSFLGCYTSEKYIFSDICIDPSRSTYIKERIKIIYEEDNIDNIVLNIKKDKLKFEMFKIIYVNIQKSDVSYDDRMKMIKQIGMAIDGFSDIHDPVVMLCISRTCDKWIFGEYTRNDFLWHIHDKKPNSYSNSLSTRVARAIVNIAAGNNLNCNIIDPCCGVGTIVLEALSMGIKAHGSDINKQIVARARDNLEFFGYDRDYIKYCDINDITKVYDVCIIDIPYGVFTKTTRDIQKNIIFCGRKLSKKSIFVTFEDMTDILKEAGFIVQKRAIVKKGKFTRYIEVCT